MRRVRGTARYNARNKDVYEDERGGETSGVQPIVLFFAAGVLGVLFGFLLTKLLTVYTVFIITVFVATLVSGLFIASSLRCVLQGAPVTERDEDEELLIRRHNAYTMLIEELEYNLTLERGAGLSVTSWQTLRSELDVFPPFVYDKLTTTYSGLAGAMHLAEEEYQNYLDEKLNLPLFLAELKEKQKFLLENI